MKKYLFILSSALFFQIFPVPVHIIFHDSVKVNNKLIYLGDIAIIETNLESDTYNILLKLEIGEAAPPGYSRFVSIDDIVNTIIRRKFNEIELNIKSSAKRISVYTEAEIQCIDMYNKLILNYIKENIKWNNGDYSVIIMNKERTWYTRKKEASVTISGLSSQYPKGNIQLELKSVQDEITLSIPVNCRINVTIPVVCAKKNIPRNQSITSDMVELAKKDITIYGFDPFTDITMVCDKISLHSISVGSIINNNSLKLLPDITKGTLVYINVKKKGIKISVPAIARENGKIGEQIWVENEASNKLIKVIIGKNDIVYLTREGESL